MKNITKSIEITDAKISFVSLVDKAANKRQFLVTKAENGKAQFSTYGKILKVDGSTHYLTGIVYEPMKEDAHGNFMTEEEIAKSAHWFVKNGIGIDTQHTFEVEDGAALVESYIAPSNMEIDGEPVLKGSWVMTVEVTDTGIWEKVQKGEITGFSMGGIGKYSEEDVALETVAKTGQTETTATEKRSILKMLAGAFGYELVEKGAMLEAYTANVKASSFWQAFWTLEDILYRYNWSADRYEFASDEATVRDALADFSAIITGLLTTYDGTTEPITKALAATGPVTKAGTKENLDAAYSALTKLRDSLADSTGGKTIEKEDLQVDKKEMQEMLNTAAEAAVQKALTAAGITAPVAKEAEEGQEPLTAENTATGAEGAAEEPLTKESIAELVAEATSDAVAKALAPLFKARGIASNLNDEQQPVEKSDTHYLAGIL